MTAKREEVVWGRIQGRLSVPQHLRVKAHAAGQIAYADAKRAEFCGDEVVWLPDEPWHQECAKLFPVHEVRELGFEMSTKGGDQFRVYSTHGTDPHVDGEGVVFVLVLANDGLKFRQGREAHVTNVGEWYVFDDCRAHTVSATQRSTSYVFLHRALSPIG